MWAKRLLVLVLGLISVGILASMWQKSQVVNHPSYRFNMAMIAPEFGVSFVSFDPVEKAILVLPFPTELAIKSRSKGEYAISSLYKLGNYQGEGGEFARKKIQGFMKIPIPGYIVTEGERKVSKARIIGELLRHTLRMGEPESSLSRLDTAYLWLRSLGYSYREIDEEELLRAGVIVDNTYQPERLQEYVGTRLFDWGIGASGTTVAVINESGENGLGSDFADFLNNLGLDVVMVRSGNSTEKLEKSEWIVGSAEKGEELSYIFETLFGLEKSKVESSVEEYRAEVVIRVGVDARELF